MDLLRVDRFAKGVVFAALAALAASMGPLALSPWVGPGPAIAAVFGGLGLAWLFCIAPRAADGFKVLLVGGPLMAAGLLVVPHPSLAAMATAASIAVVRGVFLRPGPAGRTVLREAVVGLGALGLASTFVPGGATGLALAAWAFFLVQSLPLLAGGQAAPAAGAEDAFTAALDRAERILSR